MQADSQSHSHAQIVSAVSRLTKHDLGRLRAAANTWLYGLRLNTVAHDADDLVAEAIFRTTSGQRAWKVGISFKNHLRAVMRSVADSWRKSAERRAASGRSEIRESDFREPDAGPSNSDPEDYTPVSNAPSPRPDPEKALNARQTLRDIEEHFAEDEVAGAVLHGMRVELSGPEICKHWNLTEKQFAAAIRRIRRYANRRKGEDHGDQEP